MILNAKKAVLFAAHTDDEMVCAGTLHRLAKAGCEVHVVAFTSAATFEDRAGLYHAPQVLEEFYESMRRIGVKRQHAEFYGISPSSQVHTRGQDVADFAFKYIEEHKPDLAFILSPEDENPAHAEVGRQCERVMRGRVPTVLRCNFPWNYGIGRPAVYVSLSEEDLRVKQDVIRAYKSQHFRYRYEEMLLAYARADGLSVKVEAAERFELVRGVL